MTQRNSKAGTPNINNCDLSNLIIEKDNFMKRCS